MGLDADGGGANGRVAKAVRRSRHGSFAGASKRRGIRRQGSLGRRLEDDSTLWLTLDDDEEDDDEEEVE